MSKTKTKRARRELKRDGARKIAAHQRKIAKASTSAGSIKPGPKKQPQQKQQKKDTPTTTAPTQASQKPNIPFGTYDHVLLVGEGDFSFTRSLALDHGCANVTGTSYDTLATVREKYPDFESIQDELSALVPPVPLHHGVDATKISTYKALRCQRGDNEDEDEDTEQGWDIIAFMFPHTGGLSTDVNRQVRGNQALIVSFFKSCLETSTAAQRLSILASQKHKHPAPLRRAARPPFLRMGGKIVVCLFEGEPYTLWNVRDLARHAGLKVVQSWRFDWGQYPGYKHVRTLGTVEGGGGWKGEDREARMYVFEKVPLVADSDEEKELEKEKGGRKNQNRKRERGQRESEEEDDSD